MPSLANWVGELRPETQGTELQPGRRGTPSGMFSQPAHAVLRELRVPAGADGSRVESSRNPAAAPMSAFLSRVSSERDLVVGNGEPNLTPTLGGGGSSRSSASPDVISGERNPSPSRGGGTAGLNPRGGTTGPIQRSDKRHKMQRIGSLQSNEI